MEDTLRVYEYPKSKRFQRKVLILVLMEDTLRVHYQTLILGLTRISLNPCFNGRYS